MSHGTKLFISIAKMHHIVNPAKFRRLKKHALQTNVSGYVKTGRPGILVFDGPHASITSFLRGVRSLRYLDFHHVGTRQLPPNKHIRPATGAEYSMGLHEVDSLGEVLEALDAIDMKDWFRREIGFDKRP